jgi:4-azaleucine resistance transporter AzlC
MTDGTRPEPLDGIAIDPPMPASEGSAILRDTAGTLVGFGLAGLLFGASFGIVMAASGAPLAMTVVASAAIFSGGAQFGAIGILAAGGSPMTAITTGLVLNTRFFAMAMALSRRLQVGFGEKIAMAVVAIDASLALGAVQTEPGATRRVFWRVGVVVFACWVGGTALGAVVGERIPDPRRLGLDGVFPSAFAAMFVPYLRNRRMRRTALAGGVTALVLLPFAPAGIPVLAAVIPPLVVALRRRTAPEGGMAAP